MKTSAELQQQSFIRKLTYFGLILVLFTAMTFSGRFLALVRGAPAGSSTWTVSGQARTLQLNESDQGEADLAGSTIRLALSGTRGFAITLIWLSAIEEQKKHNWNEVELLVNTITKLQPHFLTPWLFQSWNLAYNVSVESDRVRDKYFYIGRGIELLADGERLNRARGLDENGNEYVLGNPDMRFWVGFYYMNKFGSSDERQTLRSLLQMSAMNPAKRDPNALRVNRGKVDQAAFKEFVQQNPLLCRRLRDSLRCYTPEAVIDFLEDNGKLPTRYELVDGNWVLKRRSETQFPVVPDWDKSAEFAPAHAEWDGTFDSHYCAWAWHLFAQEPLPDVTPGKPEGSPPPYNPLRFRMPRQPAGIIFRQSPPRDLSYVAENLQREGWFDDQGWEVDRWQQTSQWFPNETLVVGADPRYSSQAMWKRAYQNWEQHGSHNGLNLDPATYANLLTDARPYEEAYGFPPGTGGTEFTREQLSPEMYHGYDAHWQIFNYQVNRQMTNFAHFLYRSQTEGEDMTVRLRKLFFEAKRLKDAGQLEPAIRTYEDAFTVLTGDPAKNQQGLLEKFPNFRNDNLIQDDLIEREFAYLDLLENQRSPQMRAFVAAQSLIGAGSDAKSAGLGFFGALLYQYYPRPGELPSMFTGPLHGLDSKEVPWMNPANLRSAELKSGRIKAEVQPPASAPSGMGIAPK